MGLKTQAMQTMLRLQGMLGLSLSQHQAAAGTEPELLWRRRILAPKQGKARRETRWEQKGCCRDSLSLNVMTGETNILSPKKSTIKLDKTVKSNHFRIEETDQTLIRTSRAWGSRLGCPQPPPSNADLQFNWGGRVLLPEGEGEVRVRAIAHMIRIIIS